MSGVRYQGSVTPVFEKHLYGPVAQGLLRMANVIRLLPPYVTPKKAFIEFINALDEVLAAPASAGEALPAEAGAPHAGAPKSGDPKSAAPSSKEKAA